MAGRSAAAEATSYLASSPRTSGQGGPDDPERRGRSLLQRAVEALGGSKYANVKTFVGTGVYSPFNEKGERGLVVAFVDYIRYPDSERTEFGKGKSRLIQTNVGLNGWIFDGEQKKLRDQTPEEIASHQRGLQHNIDTIIRSWQQAVKVRALPELLLWFRQRGTGIELSLRPPDGSSETVTVFVDPDNNRPVRLSYGNEEDRFYLYQTFNGVQIPLTIDHYKADVQTARIRYDGVELDRPLDAKLFEKPAHVNQVK